MNVDSPPSEEPTLQGGCLCGAVRFAYKGPIGGSLGAVTLCHCSQCRRAQGFASAAAPVRAAGYSVTEGQAQGREYASSPGKVRAFCGRCGSPLYSRRDSQPQTLRVRLGSLDAAPEPVRVDAHIFTQDAPAWSWTEDAPRYPGIEPGRG